MSTMPKDPAKTAADKRKLWSIFKNSAKSFSNDNAMKMAASLSYYTVFAIGPMLLMIITLTGLFVDRETIMEVMRGQLGALLGKDASTQVVEIITNLQSQIQGKATLFAIIAGTTLFIGATGVFLEIQDSINTIWCIKAKPKKGWLKFIMNRLLSFSLIVGMGFLLLVSLMVSALTELLLSKLQAIFGENSIIGYAINLVVLFLIVSLLFSVIFKVLPDAIIKWRDTVVGACFTGVLFLIGKFAIGAYIGNSDFGNTYGAAASVIVLLTWVYYSSIILYFGAEFTKEWAMARGSGIAPNETSVLVEKREVKELPGKKHAGPDDVPVEVVQQMKSEASGKA